MNTRDEITGKLITFGLIFCMGCTDDAPSEYGTFDRTWETEHVTYQSRTSDSGVCEGAANSVEQYVNAMANFLGLEASSIPHINYYKYENVDVMRETDACPEDATGCSNSDAIWDVRPVGGHEITHLIADRLTGGYRAHALLSEGIATALSCQPFHTKHDVEATPNWENWDSGRLDLEQYKVAGRLIVAMSYLNGLPSVLDLYRNSSSNHTVDELNRSVQEKFHYTLDEIWNIAAAKSWPYCYPVFACAGDELKEGNSSLSVGCHGYDHGTLPNNPSEILRIQSDLEMQLTRCELAEPISPELTGSTNGNDSADAAELFVELPQEKTALTFVAPEDVNAKARVVELSLVNSTGVLSETCDDGKAIKTIGAPGLAFRLTPQGRSRVIAFAQDRQRALLVSQWEQSPTGSVRWCRTCDSGKPTDCETVEYGDRQLVTADAGTQYLVFRGDSNDEYYDFLRVGIE
jgi:hypothetical protein